ncbi:MAG TPA: hypothetical protein VKB63_00515 [Gemmatimonadales bacterium]|nr:hypothetical protein [Gemmatimonadales bacterium]
MIQLESEIPRLQDHLSATVDWLKEAQDSQRDGGVSALYSLARGWHSSYPETTGYIIPTMLNVWEALADEGCYERSVAMAQWLLGLQYADGAFPGDRVGRSSGPSVFNTGQILFGLIRIYQVTRESRYLDAAHRAGRWLVSVQDPDGAWRASDYLGKTHTYNTRTAWPLLLLHQETQDPELLRAGEANVRWAVTRADETGFFSHCAFDPQDNGHGYGLGASLAAILLTRNWPAFYTKASLHAIAYAIQGLLESAWILQDDVAEATARRAARVLGDHVLAGKLAGWYGPGWKPEARSSCLTGVAQMCVVWLRMAERHDERASAAADAALRFLCDSQNIRSTNPAIRGALAGSRPFYGLYHPFRYPNWAAKFWADALLLSLALKSQPELLSRLRVW